MPDGKYSIIEYPVEGRIKIQAPVGILSLRHLGWWSQDGRRIQAEE